MNLPQIKDYTYEGFLGEGATGQVHSGKDGDRPVAIKLLKRLAVNRKLIGYSLSRLRGLPQHPNLVEVVDFAMDGKPLYIVTSLHSHKTKDGRVEGFSLEAQCGGMDPELAWAIILQICEGMAHLHKHGVVHCSLNPENVMVANPDTPEIRLTDFGQGWLTEITHIDFSESFLHASPEQLRKPQEMFEGQSQKWDVYGFGVTAYRMLYKHYPRGHRWIKQLRDGQVQFHPLAFADVISRQPEIQWPGTNDGFEDQRQRVLEKCLMLDPNDRYNDLREVLEVFDRIKRDEKQSIDRKDAHERERVLSEKVEISQKRMHYFRKAAIGTIGCLVVSLLFNVTSESRLTKRRQEIKTLKATAKREIGEAIRKEEIARQDSSRLKSNLTYSQETADAFLEFLLNAKNPNSPEYQSIDGYLSSARQHYARVLHTTEGDKALVVERLRAQLGLSRIEVQLGEPETAASKLSALVWEIQTLPEAVKQLTEVQETLGAALVETGKAKMVAGMRTGAIQSLQDSVKVYNKLSGADTKNFDLKRKYGRALFLYGQQLSRAGELTKGLKSQQGAMQVIESLAQSADAREEDEYYLALCQFEVGLIRVWENEGIEAFESFQLASQGYSRLMSQKPQIPEYRFQLARCLYYLGDLSFQEKGDVEEAKLARSSMKQLLTLLLEKDEVNRNYQFHLALVYVDLAEMARDAGEREAASENLQLATMILTELHKLNPKNADVTLHLALATTAEGEFLLDEKKADEAIGRISQAEAFFKEIDDSGVLPGVPDHVYQFRRAGVAGSHGHALEVANQAVSAGRYFSRSLEILKGLAAKRPNDVRIRAAVESLESRSPTAPAESSEEAR
ncbi:MAG: serine/threonine protein kinase [Verrucomicrobiales bacterium]|jgi:serine/threonine protein kinase